jgi:hypothetical protein
MEQLLTKLKAIEPNNEYRERSRSLILNSPQTGFYPRLAGQFLHGLQFSAAFGLAALVLFLATGGAASVNRTLSPTLLSGVDPESINQEAEKIEFQLQFSQAEYYENAAEKIEVALRETSDELKLSGDRHEQLNALLQDLTL